MPMIDSALAHAAAGRRVHPLEPKGKKPLVNDWPHKATTDEGQIREWWTQWPDANIGLATGAWSGVFAVDLDGLDGEKSWVELCGQVPGIPPETLEAMTGKGRHLFFKYPAGREVRNKQAVRPGIDVRGEGGFVVAPGSVHPSGKRYEWVDEGIPVEEAPAALLDVIAPAPARRLMPWEKPAAQTAPAPVHAPARAEKGTPVFERARLYLD